MDTGLRHEGLRTIHPGERLQLRDAAGRHRTVVQGAVWVTQHGDWRDAVLENGASYRFDRNGLSIVQALGGPATVVLEEGLEPAHPAGRKVAPQAWTVAHSERFERRARRLRADTLASLSDHLLRDLGLRRDRIDFGAHTPECTHC
jgi:uncharacterized protein YjiS (DUF1127 family)